MGKREHPVFANLPPEGKVLTGHPSRGTVIVTPEDTRQLQAYVRAIAEILYKNTNTADLVALEATEKSLRQQMLSHVSPQVAFFSSNKSLVRHKAD